MGLKLSRADRAAGLKELPGGDEQPFMPWHNPETGQEFPSLPSDTPNAMNYMIRGFRMGPATAELKAKWEAGKAERAAAYDKRMKARFKGPRGAKLRKMEQGAKNENTPAASVSEVAAEVIRQLQELGVVPATAATADDGPEGAADDAGQPA